jgi:hypothetical protein
LTIRVNASSTLAEWRAITATGPRISIPCRLESRRPKSGRASVSAVRSTSRATVA